jgi:hypothetical protein
MSERHLGILPALLLGTSAGGGRSSFTVRAAIGKRSHRSVAGETPQRYRPGHQLERQPDDVSCSTRPARGQRS